MKLNAVIAEAKKVLEDKNATQEQIDSQVTLVKDAVKSVQEVAKKVDETKPSEENRSATVEAPNRETTPARSPRGRRGRNTDVQPKSAGGSNLEAETAPKALPTYTNGAGTYKLAEEMKNIVSIMKANGADETTIAAVKANYDKLNDTLGAHEDGVLSEADFAAATANLTAARDAVEKVLDKKFEEYARTVNPDARSRQARQARETGRNFQDSREYYFEDGKTGISPYSKYTYVFHNYRPTNILDFEHQPISNAEKYILARVAPTDNGFLWTISVNAGRFSNTTNDSYWFTIPKGQTYKAGTARVDAQNLQGSTPYYGDGTIEGAMRQAGLRAVNRGANLKGVIRYGKVGANAYWTDDFKSLATQSVNALTDKGLYLPALAQDSEKQLAQAKFDKINKKGGDLFYFEQPDNVFKYTITFETEGAPNDPDKNDPEELVYAAGFKGVTRGDKVYRVLVNQWHAITDSELRDIDRYRMTLKNGGTFIVEQGKYYNKLWPYADALGPKGWYGSKNLNSDIKKVDGIITAGDQSNFTAIDFFSYVNYKLRDGKDFEGMKFEANNHGQKFTFYREDGTEITTKQLGAEAGGTPGEHVFYYKRVFTSDGSSDNGKFRFLVKPNNPVFNPTMKLAGDKQILTASGGTKGIPMTLFREYTDATGTHVVPVETKEADNNGTVTFNGENNGGVTLEKGKYFVRTVINTDSYKDYSGKTQTTLESDPATEDKKFEVVEPPVVKINGKKLTENAEDNQFIIYKGANFNPTFQVENDGKQVNYLKATNIPNGVWFNNVNGRDQEKTNMASGSTFTLANNTVDNIAKNGEATVTVRNHKNQEKVYKFKYIIADVQPKDTPKDKLVGETLGDPHSFVKAVVNGNEGDQYFPGGMSFTWETNNNQAPGNNTVLGEAGRITNYNAKVTFPANGPYEKTIDNVRYTIYGPSPKKIPVTFNVTDNVAPTVKIVDKTKNNTETVLTDSVSDAPTIDVYRGATLELPLKYYDNATTGRVNISYVNNDGIPRGVWFNKDINDNRNVDIKETGKTQNTEGNYTVIGRVDATARLGISTVTLKVSDAASGDANQGNSKEVKFRVRVLDLDFEQGESAQAGVSKITKELEINQATGDPNNYLTVNDGAQRSDSLFPTGMTFRYIRGTEYKTNLTYTTPGKHIEKVAAFYPKTYVPTNGESVTAPNATGDKVVEILGRAYVSRNIEFQVKPTAPTVTAKENGDVVVAHTNQTNVNKLSFTYIDVSGAQQTVTATKNRNSWTLDNTSIDGVTINATSGEVTIKDRAVRDATDVTAKVVTSDEVNSNNTTTASGAGERVAPEFSFDGTNTTLENGARTVYVTPTETNSFKLGTVTDNSKKIIESRLSSDLDYGLSYEGKLVKTANREETAPKDIIITGKLDRTNKSNSGNRWNDGDQIVTRYVVATDASGNVLNNPTNTPSNPTRVVFKVLTQATKYTPQVATQAINKDITANGATLTDTEFNAIKSKIKFTTTKGAVKVAYDTTDMAITMNDRGAIKRNSDGTYYVGATVTYPDKTTDTIQIPVEKSDKLPPTVKMNGIDLTETADDNHFIIYKGAKFNPTFEVNDNSGTTTYLKAEGIPNGVWFNRQGERDFPKENMRNGTRYQLSTNNTVDSIEPLGDHEARVIVKDALNNEKTYKFKYTIVDVDVKDSPKNVRLNSQLGQPQRFLTTTAANRVNSGDKYFPDGMRYKWIKNNQDVVQTTPLSKSGTITDYKAVAEFANGERTYTKNIDGKNVTIYAPAKIEKTVTFIVTEDSPPTVKMTNPSNNQITELSGDDSNSPIVTIYRKGQLNIPLSFYDNEATGRVNLQYVEGLPKGVSFGANNTVSVTGAVANANKTHIISGRVDPDAKLGMSTVTMKVSDGANGVDSGNQGEVKFRIRVLDVDFEEAKSAEENRSSITVEVNVGEQISDPNYYLTVNDGTVRRDNRDYRTEGPELDRFPSGMTFRYVSSDGSSTTRKLQYNAPGQYTVKARAYFPGNHAATNGVSEVVSGQTGDNAEINGRRYIEKTIVFRVKPTAPVVTPQDNGDVTITQRNETNVNRLSVTYTTQGDNPEEVTYTASKNGTTWSFVDGTPISIDGATGTIKIKDRLVQDGSTVKVKAIVSRDTGDVASDEASGDAKPGDALYPTIDFQNEETDSSGNRVVYITPTETTNLDVATVSDNSNKLLEAVFFDQGAKVTDLGNYGITYNKVTRNGDTITNAPYTLTVTGTLNREKSANTVWNDDDVITTRYASAMDAAENNIKDKSGSRDNVASNPYRVVFKVRTQAAKYTPTVSKSKIERDITQANATITDPEFNKIKETLTFSSTRGEVKVKKDTTGLTFEIKNRTVQAKQDGSLYITATVVYPDGSRDDIDVPLDTTDANKAKPALTTKEVSIKAAKAKEQQGSVPSTEYNRVLSNVTVPQGQPQPTAKEVKNNGLISEVDGKKVVTVGLTFKDNTKKDVTVPVLEVKPVDITTTFNELDNSVTVKPNTRVEEGDKLHVTIRGVGMELTKTATGYTSNRDDREFTVSDDGSIAIRLLGNETFQAGDRVVTRHESNKNGKVDSYETEAFAGLKPVEKVPAINLTNLTPKEIEAVKAAVKKANPSVNVSELQVAPNGDVTYTHRGEGVGENDSVPTLNLRETVRERNDAEKIDPTVKTLTRHDQQPKHTDENVKDAVTGANIKSKELLDPIPDESGNVRVKVTYDDDSSETVTVPITVTPSKATQEDPTVKTLTRHDQQPKHTDENVKDAVTGANIKSKELLDPIPDESGNVRVKVTYDDDSSETVTVPITVVGLPKAKVPVESFGNLTKEEQDKVKESVEKANPGKTVVVEPSGKVIITDPKTNVSHEISEELVTTIAPPVVDIPEFNGGVNGEPEKQEELPEFNGGVNGEPEVQPDLPEFNGGVNGELPDPVQLPKVQLIITKWVDEQGNELKPADAKAPSVLGEANEAFEHGEIEGYVFVRTETKGDVVIHVFRKVSPVRPTGDGQQGPATPSDDTNRRPDTATPAEVPVVQPAEQPSQTVKVPTQLLNEVSETNPSVSQPQAVLPNTGTQEDRATGAFGLLSLLGAFGLLFAKKKKDDEEEA